jgi:hypothetical protein
MILQIGNRLLAVQHHAKKRYEGGDVHQRYIHPEVLDRENATNALLGLQRGSSVNDLRRAGSRSQSVDRRILFVTPPWHLKLGGRERQNSTSL